MLTRILLNGLGSLAGLRVLRSLRGDVLIGGFEGENLRVIFVISCREGGE